ncbi:hypothetical protein C8R44DRAFT_729102 [Mycena epipterygia]|nr:hypothetical protein C8R44DRAFT_729102 [Mycena epipterygia]
MDPPQQAEDPIIVPLHSCQLCQIGILDPLRVHEGSNNVPARGKIVQTCKACYKSHYHTPAYVYSDAQHLLIRINARQLRTIIPHNSVNAPLRFAPPALPIPPPGPVHCTTVGCFTKDGSPRQASRKCIQYQCKTCCTQAGLDATEEGTYRDSCKAHSVPGAEGQVFRVPREDLPVPIQLPNVPVHQQVIPNNRVLQAGRGRGAPAPRARPRSLVQPMSMTWMNQRKVVVEQNGPDPKSERQRLDKIAQHSCTFIVYYTKGKDPVKLEHSVASYPQMQLSATPALLKGIGLTENSWFDIHDESSESAWKTIQATAVFTVDKARSIIIRIRPSLLLELALEDCPGLDAILNQPRSTKRRLGDLVSPPKKIPCTESVSVTTQARTGIELADSPPSSPSLLPLTRPLNAEPVPEKRWPTGFYAYEHHAAWVKYTKLQDDHRSTSISIPQYFGELFPGATYVKTTVTGWRKFWFAAPADLRNLCVIFGHTQNGSWVCFVIAVRAREAGSTFIFPDPVVNVEATAIAAAIPAPPAAHLPIITPATADAILVMSKFGSGNRFELESWQHSLYTAPRRCYSRDNRETTVLTLTNAQSMLQKFQTTQKICFDQGYPNLDSAAQKDGLEAVQFTIMSSVLDAADARRARPRSAQNPQVNADELARPSPLTGIRLSQEVHTIYFHNQFVLLLTFNGPTPTENKHRDASPELYVIRDIMISNIDSEIQPTLIKENSVLSTGGGRVTSSTRNIDDVC